MFNYIFKLHEIFEVQVRDLFKIIKSSKFDEEAQILNELVFPKFGEKSFREI